MGVVTIVRRLLGSVAGIAATRLELLSLELEQERLRVARLCIQAALTLFLLFTAVVLGLAGLLLWAEPAHRAALAGALALGFLGAAAATAWRWRRLASAPSPLLRSAVADLRRVDRGSTRAASST